jgi:glucosamine--fructose-6-phosphate aminotransferase (isomerizing)
MEQFDFMVLSQRGHRISRANRMIVFGVQMAAELTAAPEAMRRQERVLPYCLKPPVERMRCKPPQVVVACARGRSAHAATFGKRVIERYLGIPVAAVASNIHRRLRPPAISQSGTSGNIIEQAMAARSSGAATACITNDTTSQLAQCRELGN